MIDHFLDELEEFPGFWSPNHFQEIIFVCKNTASQESRTQQKICISIRRCKLSAVYCMLTYKFWPKLPHVALLSETGTNFCIYLFKTVLFAAININFAMKNYGVAINAVVEALFGGEFAPNHAFRRVRRRFLFSECRICLIFCILLSGTTNFFLQAADNLPWVCFSPRRIIFQEIIFVCKNTTPIFAISDHIVSNHFTASLLYTSRMLG